MPRTVLVPHTVAERCYLPEALLWVANSRFPLASITENNEDIREDHEYIDGLTPAFAEDEPLSDEECARAGLPPNPERRCFEDGDYYSKPDDIRHLLKIAPFEEDRKRLEKDLPASEAFFAKQAEWDAEFEAFLDLHKSRLFLALQEGRIGAIGQELPRPTYSGSLEFLEGSDWESWYDVPWTQIPQDFWISTKIDWSESWAEGRKTAYCLILVESEQLFEQFPPPIEPATGVVKVGSAFAQDPGTNPNPPRVIARGRPAADWDAFHLEVTKRLQQGTVPAKQEAFIAEMQEWCRAKWHRNVGRSTLSQKLKPYYDTFIRKSEKTDD